MGNRKQPFGYKMALGKIVIQEPRCISYIDIGFAILSVLL